MTLELPPLRERRGAATVLAHDMLRKFGGAHGRPKRGFTEDALRRSETYDVAGQRP